MRIGRAVITALAVKASMPFAAMILTDAEARWRGAFAAAYVVALALIAGYAVGPEALVEFLGRYSAQLGDDAVIGMI